MIPICKELPSTITHKLTERAVDPCLDPEAAAEDLVVVVVDRVGVAEAPHGVARRRVHHAAVAPDHVQHGLG